MKNRWLDSFAFAQRSDASLLDSVCNKTTSCRTCIACRCFLDYISLSATLRSLSTAEKRVRRSSSPSCWFDVKTSLILEWCYLIPDCTVELSADITNTKIALREEVFAAFDQLRFQFSVFNDCLQHSSQIQDLWCVRRLLMQSRTEAHRLSQLPYFSRNRKLVVFARTKMIRAERDGFKAMILTWSHICHVFLFVWRSWCVHLSLRCTTPPPRM